MLVLVLAAGTSRFALSGEEVVEVVPRPALERLPGLPPGWAGHCQYLGRPLAVVALGALLGGLMPTPRLSNRVLILRRPNETDASVGLLVDALLEVRRLVGRTLSVRSGLQPGSGPLMPHCQGFMQDGAGILPLLSVESLMAAAQAGGA